MINFFTEDTLIEQCEKETGSTKTTLSEAKAYFETKGYEVITSGAFYLNEEYTQTFELAKS